MLKKEKFGFTLIEILLSISILGLLAGIMMPVYVVFQSRNDLDVSVNQIISCLRKAQILAESNQGDSNWGVFLTTGGMTLFKGNNYLTRDSSFDEIYSLSNNINVSGLTEIVYTKFLGQPQSNGNIILAKPEGEVRNINLNNYGVISF